jgi:hypothetical protein
LSDDVAEHIPGCNMAFRREQLMAIGGFDPRFRIAGDDVDICWRLQERGWTIGFAPTAVVWHHPRNSIKAYLKQQSGYAKAEALLAGKWPEKYNNAGHSTWHGRLYGRGIVESLLPRSRIYHGVWGSAPFQSVYQPCSGNLLLSLTLMPEWYFLLAALGLLTAAGASWRPLLWMSPLLVAGVSLTVMQAARAGQRAVFYPEPCSGLRRVALRFLVGWLHIVQPVARLIGRVRHGLGPWNWSGFVGISPLPTVHSLWSERWDPIETRLSELVAILKDSHAAVMFGGDFDRWDIAIRGGFFGEVRAIAMVEEHEEGRQLCRFRTWPKPPTAALAAVIALAGLAGLAGLDHAWVACASLSVAAGALGLLIYADCAIAMSRWRDAVDRYLDRNRHLHVVAPKSAIG